MKKEKQNFNTDQSEEKKQSSEKPAVPGNLAIDWELGGAMEVYVNKHVGSKEKK